MKTTRFGRINKIKPTMQFKIIVSVFFIACATMFVSNVYTQTTIDRLATPVNAQSVEKQYTDVQSWVLNEVDKAGIDQYKVYMLIYGESRWNTQATNINKGGRLGIDRGLWQISDKFHPEVSNACAYDYKCATKEAIRIIKKQGFTPWYAAQYYGLK